MRSLAFTGLLSPASDLWGAASSDRREGRFVRRESVVTPLLTRQLRLLHRSDILWQETNARLNDADESLIVAGVLRTLLGELGAPSSLRSQQTGARVQPLLHVPSDALHDGVAASRRLVSSRLLLVPECVLGATVQNVLSNDAVLKAEKQTFVVVRTCDHTAQNFHLVLHQVLCDSKRTIRSFCKIVKAKYYMLKVFERRLPTCSMHNALRVVYAIMTTRYRMKLTWMRIDRNWPCVNLVFYCLPTV